MTRDELIEKLSKIPENLEVFMADWNEEYQLPVSVERVNVMNTSTCGNSRRRKCVVLDVKDCDLLEKYSD